MEKLVLGGGKDERKGYQLHRVGDGKQKQLLSFVMALFFPPIKQELRGSASGGR